MTCFMVLLTMCITAASCNGEGMESFSNLFHKLFVDGQLNNCDVRKYEEVTGFRLDFCDALPIDGLVPDDSVCDFTAGLMTKTTQYCYKGFWFTAQTHPHSHHILKRAADPIKDILKTYNQRAPEDKQVDLNSVSSTPTAPTTSTMSYETGTITDWENCPTDPIIITPQRGKTEVDLTEHFTEPSKKESGWEVSLSKTSQYWIEKDGTKLTASAATYNGQTMSLSYRATHTASGKKDTCKLEFRFEVNMCDMSTIRQHANATNVACDKKSWGIHGERCNMTCKDVDQTMNAENKQVHVTCEMDGDDNVDWKWYTEAEESGDPPEEIEQPICEPIVCKPTDIFDINEESELECWDLGTEDYVPVEAADDVASGSSCRRRCMDRGGDVCGDMEDTEREFTTYNHYTCSYNGEWTRAQEKCGTHRVWQQCTPTVMPMNHGKMCCRGDTCTVTCNEGFSPARGSKPNAVCRRDEEDDMYKWHRCEDDMDNCEALEEDFPGEMCKATCDGLPFELTNMKLDSIVGTSDCSGTEIGGICDISCSDYSYLRGSTYATCEINYEDNSAEWKIPEGVDEPECEAQLCEDLVAPEEGFVSCMYDDGLNTCNVTCLEGFTHSLRYKTQFQCDTYDTNGWPEKEDIPKCVEATVPEVKLTLKANLEANVDTCNRLGDFVNEDELITAVQTMCPPTCNCTMGELKSTASGDNKCLVELPFTLDCGDYGLTRQMAKIWSMIEAPGAHNEDITVSSYPDITDIKQTCGEGRSLHMQDGEAKCIMCNKGTAYNADSRECEPCESGNSVDGECVDYAATEPDPVKCTKFDKRRKELKFTNCSKSQTDDERLVVDTFCIVECDNKHEHLTVNGEIGDTVYAWCAADGDDEEGKWQYNHDYFACEAYDCIPGEFSESGKEPCDKCEEGHYSVMSGSTECLQCPEGLVAPKRGSYECFTNDTVTCDMGYYFDHGSWKCRICPYSAYCDGYYKYNCPNKMVTEDMGSLWDGDCKNDTWSVIGEDPDDPEERKVTITGLTDVSYLAFMEFRMCRFSSDLRVELSLPPYRFQISGNGHFKFLDSDHVLCTKNNFFDCSETECGTNVTMWVKDNHIELNYGCGSILCRPEGDFITPIEEGLEQMIITVSSRDENNPVNMNDVPEHDVPHFAYLAIYTSTNIHGEDSNSTTGDSGADKPGYDYGNMPPDDSADAYWEGTTDSPSGPPPSGTWSSSTSDMPPSGPPPSSTKYGEDFSDIPTGMTSSVPPQSSTWSLPTSDYYSEITPSEPYQSSKWNDEAFSSVYPTGMPPSGSWQEDGSTNPPPGLDFGSSTPLFRRRKRGIYSSSSSAPGSSPSSSISSPSPTSSTSPTSPTSSTSPTSPTSSTVSTTTTNAFTPTLSTESTTDFTSETTSTAYFSTNSPETTTITSSTTGTPTTTTTSFTTTGSYYNYESTTLDDSSNDGSAYDDTRNTPNRNCFENMLNKAHFSDREISMKPPSCRQMDCEFGNENPDRFTCKQCAIGQYYDYMSEKCVVCPNYGVTRKVGAKEETECHGDSWSVGVSSNSTPSAVIAGLSLENFCLLKFYVHKPAEPLQFDFTFHEYRLEVYMDQTFAMFLREDKIIDGSGENLFGEEEGWQVIKVSFDTATLELILEWGTLEMRSPSLISITDDFAIPTNQEIDVNIQVTSETPGARVYFAYLQVYEDCDSTADCRANALANSFDYLEGSGVSSNLPYSCPDTAEYWSCTELRDLYGNQYMMDFACTNGRSLYSECVVSCTDYYSHGATRLKCQGTHWDFDFLSRGAPQCKMEFPEPATCRTPSLPSNVIWTGTSALSIGEFKPECKDIGYEFRRGGYDTSTVYTCNNDSLKWEPDTTDDIPECYKTESVKPSLSLELEKYNGQRLDCEDQRNIITESIHSPEVTGNSPEGWNARQGINKVHCGTLEGDNSEVATEDDEEIKNIREQSDCEECDPGCYEEMWENIQTRLQSAIQSNVDQVFEKVPEMMKASSDARPDEVENIASELTALADNSNELLDDNGVNEFIDEVKSKSESCSDYELKKQFGLLSSNIDESITNLTKLVKANAQSIDQQAQAVGADSSGRIIKVESLISFDLSADEWDTLQNVKEMRNTFAQILEDSGQTVVDNSSKTDVTCGEGKVIASKGQCETTSCLDDETKDENGECKKCNKWTSIIDDEGRCVKCGDNERVSETKDGRRVCTSPCPAGSASTEGFTDPDTGECDPCDTGEYQDNTGSKQCLSCPGIQTNFETESTSCTPDYDLCLNNTSENPIVLKKLNSDGPWVELTLSLMLKKTKENVGFGVDFDSYTAILDGNSFTMCDPNSDGCAVFRFNSDSTGDAEFVEYTQLAFTISGGEIHSYIDGVELPSDQPANVEGFEIKAESDFKVYGASCITNWFISNEREDNIEGLSSRDGIAMEKNKFRDPDLSAEEYDASQATTKPTAYSGERTDYCANNPCENGGSCSRAMGKANCSCPTGYEGNNCEKKFEVQEPTWSDWRDGPCSVTCGTGSMTQNRTCQVEPCIGDASRTVTCNPQDCKVCPTLEYDAAKVKANISEDGSRVEFYCSGTNQKFAKIDGTKTPDTVFECGPDTDYEWEPNSITPQCTTTVIASTFTRSVDLLFTDPAVVDTIPCEPTPLDEWKAECIAELETKVDCLNSSSLYPCTVSSVEVTRCNTTPLRRRRRQTVGESDVVLEFTLELDDQAQLDIQNMYDNHIVEDSLLEVVQALADLDSVVSSMQSLTLTINNVNYTVDPKSVTSTSSVTCPTGQYADGTDCVKCGAGTYQDTATTFCVLCPMGEYQDQEAMTSCNECPEGLTTQNTGSTALSHCNITVTTDATCSGSGCDDSGDEDDEDGGGSDGKIIGIAVGAAVGGLVLIGGVAVVVYRACATSKSKSAQLANQNLIHPKHPRVPEKDKLYNEIVNPHFVPPPKPVQAAYNKPTPGNPPNYEYLTVGQPDARAVTLPGISD